MERASENAEDYGQAPLAPEPGGEGKVFFEPTVGQRVAGWILQFCGVLTLLLALMLWMVSFVVAISRGAADGGSTAGGVVIFVALTFVLSLVGAVVMDLGGILRGTRVALPPSQFLLRLFDDHLVEFTALCTVPFLAVGLLHSLSGDWAGYGLLFLGFGIGFALPRGLKALVRKLASEPLVH